MTNVIILGDPHLGKGVSLGKSTVGNNLNSRIVDQINLLDWTLEQALETNADHIIITGDVFEEPKPHHSLVALFLAWLKKCQANQVHVHVMIGNHDILRSGAVSTSALDIITEAELEGINIYKDINTILIGTSAFTLVPFRDRKSFNVDSNAAALSLLKDSIVYELAGIPITYKKFLVGHLAIEGSIPVGDEIDDISNELFCPLTMFSGYDCVWMGHVHKPQVMSKKPYIAHIGSMDISNFAETDHKKNIVIVDTTSDHISFTEKLLPTRSLKKVNLVIPKDTIDTTSYVIQELEKMQEDWNKSIVKVEISLSVPELLSINKSTIEKFLLGRGAFNVSGILESKKISLIKKMSASISPNLSIDNKMDVVSAIKTYAQTYVDASVRDNFIELSLDILNIYKSEAK